VFTVAGEELGLLGGSTLILLVGVVLWRGLRIAARAPDAYGRWWPAAWWRGSPFQSFVNIGMTLGIMPVTGLPLPFVSYGGSSMFACLVAVGPPAGRPPPLHPPLRGLSVEGCAASRRAGESRRGAPLDGTWLPARQRT
jgi:hypothetical protein